MDGSRKKRPKGQTSDQAREHGVGELAFFGLQHLRPQGQRQVEPKFGCRLDIGRDFGAKAQGKDWMVFSGGGGSCTAARTPASVPRIGVTRATGKASQGPAPPPLLSRPYSPPPNTPPRAPVTPPLRGGRLSGWSWKGALPRTLLGSQGSEAGLPPTQARGGSWTAHRPASGSRSARNASWDAPRGLSPCPAALSQS